MTQSLKKHTYMLRGEGLSGVSFATLADEIKDMDEYKNTSTASIVLRRRSSSGELEICAPLEGRGKSKGWHLIGGKRFGAENASVAAMREFIEETGLTAGPLSEAFDSPDTKVVYWPMGQVLVYIIDLEVGHPYQSIDLIHSYVDKLSETPKTTFADLKWIPASVIENARNLKEYDEETRKTVITRKGTPIPSDAEIRQQKNSIKAQEKEEMKKSYPLSGMFDSMLDDQIIRENILQE